MDEYISLQLSEEAEEIAIRRLITILGISILAGISLVIFVGGWFR